MELPWCQFFWGGLNQNEVSGELSSEKIRSVAMGNPKINLLVQAISAEIIHLEKSEYLYAWSVNLRKLEAQACCQPLLCHSCKNLFVGSFDKLSFVNKFRRSLIQHREYQTNTPEHKISKFIQNESQKEGSWGKSLMIDQGQVWLNSSLGINSFLGLSSWFVLIRGPPNQVLV